MARFRPAADGLWTARTKGQFAGSIAIDGSGFPGEGARLRWFITQPSYQGVGIGKRLIDRAISFCVAAKHQRVFLWTFEGLRAARSLYERNGFTLAEERKIDQWGQIINEQMFELYPKI